VHFLICDKLWLVHFLNCTKLWLVNFWSVPSYSRGGYQINLYPAVAGALFDLHHTLASAVLISAKLKLVPYLIWNELELVQFRICTNLWLVHV